MGGIFFKQIFCLGYITNVSFKSLNSQNLCATFVQFGLHLSIADVQYVGHVHVYSRFILHTSVHIPRVSGGGTQAIQDLAHKKILKYMLNSMHTCLSIDTEKAFEASALEEMLKAILE